MVRAPRFGGSVRSALAIAGAILAAAVAMRVALVASPAAIAEDLAQPLAVVTAWHAFGALLLAMLAAAIALATPAYLRVLRDGTARIAAVAGSATIAVLCAWLAPVVFSSDVYAYAAYGEILRTGGDPYAHVALSPQNPVFAAAIWQWGNPPPSCVYGPLFAGIAAVVVGVLQHGGVALVLDGLRALASLALIACAALAYAAYPGSASERAIAAATIALNPAAIWSAVEGHNDALALACVLAAYALFQRRAAAGAMALIAAAASIKFTGAAAAIGFTVRGARGVTAFVVAIVLTLVAAVPLLREAFAHVATTGHYAPQGSLQAVVWPIGWIAALAVAALLCRQAVASLRRGEREGWVWLAVTAWVLIPNPYPWYGIWLAAAAALAPRTRIALVATLLSITAVLRYVPDAVGTPGPALGAALGIAAALPLIALVRQKTQQDYGPASQ